MEVVLSALHLAGPGGVQSYLLTVAPHLERLGHGVTLWAPEQGPVAQLARDRGLRVAASEDDLPSDVDAVLAQEAVTALLMAERYPQAARAIVVHGADLDLHLPPQLEGVVAAAIVMNAATEARARASAAPVEIVRLRQPIDTAWFRPLGAVRERPRRALLLGNYLDGRRRTELEAACASAGLAVEIVGTRATPSLDPRPAIAAADVVIGQGRSVLEAMACGRAAIVLGPAAGDGWVEPGVYPALEADGFRGTATPAMPSGASLRETLAGYRPEMGEVNRSLVVAHHSAFDHAVELAALLGDLAPARPPAVSDLRELARLTRNVYEIGARANGLARELRVANARNEELQARHEALTSTRRWRAAQALARPAELLRRVRR